MRLPATSRSAALGALFLLLLGLFLLARRASETGSPDASGANDGSTATEAELGGRAAGSEAAVAGATDEAAQDAEGAERTVRVRGVVRTTEGVPPLGGVFRVYPGRCPQGALDEYGRFDVAVGLPSRVQRASLIIRVPGWPWTEQVLQIEDGTCVEAEVLLRREGVLHGIVRDHDGHPVPGVGMLWELPELCQTVYHRPAAGFAYTYWKSPWAVTDLAGRFGLTGPPDPAGMAPMSLDDAWALSVEHWGRATVDDPILLRARPTLGLDLHALDEVTGEPVHGLVLYVLRAGGRAVMRGVSCVGDTGAFDAVAWPDDASDEGKVLYLVDADGHPVQRGSVCCRRGQGPARVDLLLKPGGPADHYVKASIRVPGVLRLARRCRMVIEDVHVLGEGADATEVAAWIDRYGLTDDEVWFFLRPGLHRLHIYEHDAPYARLSPWRLDVEVDEADTSTLDVQEPVVGSLQILDEQPREGRRPRRRLHVETPGGVRVRLGSQFVFAGEAVLPDFPAGDWVLVETTRSDVEVRRVPFHVDRGRETTVTLE